MEHASCNVIYVDRTVSEDRFIRGDADTVGKDKTEWESAHIAENVKLLLDVFGEVHLCSTGGACLTQWLNLQDVSMVDLKPTLILIDTPFQEQLPDRSRSTSPSPDSPPDEDSENHEEELYGFGLLRRIKSESYLRNLSRLVVPISIVTYPGYEFPASTDIAGGFKGDNSNTKLYYGSVHSRTTANRRMLKKCLDLGATDVMASPMNGKCINNLEVHAYRAHRDAARDQKAFMEVRRGRKRSWVGINDEKPFAYLREAMVSGLMNGICRIDDQNENLLGNFKISVSAEKHAEISLAISQWHFCAHDFSDDELIVAAALMFKHALSMPELESWRIPTDQLHGFLAACRGAYNGFVPYHNFRHVVDVLQATFNFLVHIRALPPYPHSNNPPPVVQPKSPIALLLHPFEALTLLVTAIGHDVGHPGVNNGFLVTLNAPLAQLYNDRSVLESFHCAAYSQILRRYWPSAFGDSKMRSLMISSILATDMGLHFDYMKRLKDLQDKLREKNSTEAWEGRMVDEQRALACALLIKCADISNVARRHDTAVQWMHNLSDEFSRQASMETELKIPTSLAVPPKKELLALAKAQLGFMNLFALPLFQGVADILPDMQYCMDELLLNKSLFEKCVANELQVQNPTNESLQRPETTTLEIRSVNTSAEPKTESQPTEQEVGAPSRVVETQDSAEMGATEHQPKPTEKRPRVSEPTGRHDNVNGMTTSFDTVADFARSDPFHVNDDGKAQGPVKQRRSETTEGSSAPCSGDWASQATSATTGKMPLSPSTQGTSIVSRDSMDRPSSVQLAVITAPESTTTVPESVQSQTELKVDGRRLVADKPLLNGHADGPEKSLEVEAEHGKSLKKKPSRFRINGLPSFFSRKHKSSSPPSQAADTAG
ncbi:hypothetical protein B0T17DRAFT_494020 [Bombardia bombarda]|uniref:Phosphodiesterase n=1 Tax=Bombardia bombarda TaxID=252184 RepID=A0AA39WTS2_9PEZI|nr:hypothetical protein B0T17DRAFT_494020 [Bombardia bombarda]